MLAGMPAARLAVTNKNPSLSGRSAGPTLLSPHGLRLDGACGNRCIVSVGTGNVLLARRMSVFNGRTF
jgi:hypothetical protein